MTTWRSRPQLTRKPNLWRLVSSHHPHYHPHQQQLLSWHFSQHVSSPSLCFFPLHGSAGSSTGSIKARFENIAKQKEEEDRKRAEEERARRQAKDKQEQEEARLKMEATKAPSPVPAASPSPAPSPVPAASPSPAPSPTPPVQPAAVSAFQVGSAGLVSILWSQNVLMCRNFNTQCCISKMQP